MTPLNGPALPRLEPRKNDSHKGDYGRCLLIGGSVGMYGAIAMAGQAALCSGAGLVTVATPEPCVDVVAGFEPCYMTLPLPVDGVGQLGAIAQDRVSNCVADSVAVGPGFGSEPSVEEFVVWLYRELPRPLLIDADGINALARRNVDLRDSAGPRVLTPHPGEFRRLVGDNSLGVQELRRLAPEWSKDHCVVLVLKGHRTLTTNGESTYENSTGNPGMATGGSGDILTGILTALIGQRLAPLDAARLAVYLHGLAGDLAAAKYGQVSLIARDLIEFLPLAFQQHQVDAS